MLGDCSEDQTMPITCDRTLPTEYYQLLTKYKLLLEEYENYKKGIMPPPKSEPWQDPFLTSP